MKVNLRLSLAMVILSLSVTAGFAQIRVTHRFVNDAALDVFFIKDFDINRPGTGPPIFFIDIENEDATAHTVVMRLSVASRNRGRLSNGETGSFTLQPNQVVNLSSNDIFSNSGLYRLQTYQVDEAAVRDLVNDVLSTGRLPRDVYTFRVELLDAAEGGIFDTEVFDIRVSNPHKLDLIFPGAPASGGLSDCPVLFTELPQFRWESDMRIFRMVIAPIRKGQDPENALNNEPRYTRIFVLQSNQGGLVSPGDLPFNDRIEIIPNTSFQFPPSGEVLQLKKGTFVWQVTGIVRTSSGPLQFKSEIFCFRVVNLDKVDTGMEQLRVVLKNLLGGDYEKLFGEGGELEGYLPKRIRFDGKEVTPGELLIRLQKISEKYKGYRVE